jgi:MFS family permease
LVSAVGAANVVVVQAISFVVSAVSLLAIRAVEDVVRREPRGLWSEIREGLGYVARNRVLRAIAVTSAMNNFAFAIASAVNLVFLVRTLRLTPTWVGIVLAAGSASAMVGAAMTPRLARRFGSERIIWLSLVFAGALSFLVPLGRPGGLTVLVVIGLAAGEFGQIVYAISSVTLRQRIVPPELLGRVGATMRFVLMGLFPLGALLGGALGTTAGPRWTLLVSGGLIAVSWLPVYCATSRPWRVFRRHADQLS